MNESDLRSDVHYLGSSENKAWKKFRPVRDPVYDLHIFLTVSSKKVGSVFLCMELFPLKVCELDQINFAY